MQRAGESPAKVGGELSHLILSIWPAGARSQSAYTRHAGPSSKPLWRKPLRLIKIVP